ncbi:hypothetical protein [Marinobacter sp.]|uniref:hypothetical protein n=1 Tax=Marinobacter sp. TaxID=50741 RepID=UPI003850F6FD
MAASAQPPAVKRLDWCHNGAQADESSWQESGIRLAGEVEHPQWEPAPVVLPRAKWPEPAEPARKRGWQLKEPAIRPDSLRPNVNESRTAVQIAAEQQTAALLQSAEPTPGLEELPEELQGLSFRVEVGVEYRF